MFERLDWMIGFSSDNPVADKFSRERIRSIRRFVLLYYLSIIAPFIELGLHYPHHIATQVFGGILCVAVVFRFRHWVFTVPPDKSEDVNPVAARLTASMVVILSLSQLYFYASLAWDAAADWRDGIMILALGVVAALTQAQAMTGIIFASRVIFLGLLGPLVVCIPLIMPDFDIPVTVAVTMLCAIGFRLAEASHDTQLMLFNAQYEADVARQKAERINQKLNNARGKAQHQADTDSLTGLRNRSSFLRDVSERAVAGDCGLLTLIDLNRFKPINDLYGHHAGDVALRFVARRLQRSLPDEAIIGRLGGDEFGVFLGLDADRLRDLDALCDAFDAALARLRCPMRVANSTVTIGASGGARVLGPQTRDMEEALRDADFALYAAKKTGMQSIRLFDNDLHDGAMRTKTIETALLALDPGEDLSLVYQPIVNLKTGALAGFEALSRWRHPVLGEISPAEFIPVAEQLGRIEGITLTLLKRALAFARHWPDHCDLSFNLSAAHICSPNAASDLVALVGKSGFPTGRLQFEITETAMLVNFETARSNVEILRAAGCRIALDDFGAGFASLVHLREIRFDKVKIDGSLIRAARQSDGRDMLRGVITMIEAMKLEAVAEYIATGEDVANVQDLGAAFGQGYFLGKPLDETAVLALLANPEGLLSLVRPEGPANGANVLPFGMRA